MNDELPCLDLLDATPAILRGLISEISDEDARWRRAPDRFSIAEVLAHLSHSEGHCYRARVDRFLLLKATIKAEEGSGVTIDPSNPSKPPSPLTAGGVKETDIEYATGPRDGIEAAGDIDSETE